MTSSDGFYSPPYWHTPETSTVPSQRASVPSGHEGTGQPHTGGPQVDKQSSWTQVPGKACSDEQSVIHKSVTPSRHDYLQLTEAVLSPTQNCQTGAQLDVPYLPPVCSNYNPVEVQDGQVGFDRVPRTPEASTTYSLHSVLSLPEGGIDGEAVHPEPDKDFSASVEEECQDPLSTSADSPQNGCLQLTDAIVCHTLHPHTVDIPESFSQSPEHNSGQVSSDRSNTPVQLQEVLGSNRSPKTHSADEAFNLDPVIDAGLSPQPPLGPRSLTETSEALEACSSVGEHGETALLSREVDSNGEIFQPAPDEVTAGDSVEVPLPTSAAECPSEGTVQNVSLEQAGGVAWHTHTVDTHAASAPDVCGLPSPSLEHNSGSVCSDYVLVELHDGNASDSAPITHTADINLGLNPVMTRDLLVASEAAAGVSSPEEHGEPAVFVGDVDTEAEKAAQPLPDKVTAADSVEENSSKSCLFTSANAELGVCQKETLGSLTPSTLEPLSNPANSNETRPDSESWTKCVPPTDFQVAADTTDTSAKEKQTQTGCCDTQLQNNHQQSQASADPSESAGLPYSLRRRRRGATTTTSSSADSSSAPVSAKRSCPGLVQSCSSIPTPEEGCSQEAPSALTVPVKRKRGRPRKIKQPVDLNEVSSTASVAAEKAESKPLVSESPVTQDCLEETPDTSLSTRRHLKRKAAEAAATSSSAVGGETEGQGNTDSPLDPPLTLSTDAQQSQLLSQEPELAEAPSSDLSFEQILQDDPMPLTPLSLPEEEEMEEEDPEDEEELPSILERKPLSITEGLCVWCKFRKYPFWPAVVKSVNHKNKKASIVFIDTFLIDEKGIRKGLTVSLKTLKPLDCEDAEELTEQARQQYGEAITWCLELIYDYRIRIGCGSFSGSFIEYFASDISCPLRQNYSQGTSDLTFPTQLIVDDLFESSEEDGVGEQIEGQQCKKLLPDRAKAARTRANEKLVDFIVRKRGAEKRLLAVIGGQDTSKWLRALQKASRFVVDPYLEDEEQVDQVYRYLDELLRRSPQTLPCLAHLERIPLILDVLLPEALICAIAGVDDISLEQAEEKYRKGPCISKRERQEFNMRIEQLMKTLNQCKQVL